MKAQEFAAIFSELGIANRPVQKYIGSYPGLSNGKIDRKMRNLRNLCGNYAPGFAAHSKICPHNERQ